MSTNNIILDANVAHSIRIHWSRSNIDHPSYIQMPCIISWSLGISLKCSLHYLLLVPLSVVLNMIRGDLSEWILDTHSQIIQLMECLQTPQVGLFLRINLVQFVVTNTKRLNKSFGREKWLLQRHQSYNRRTFGKFLARLESESASKGLFRFVLL